MSSIENYGSHTTDLQDFKPRTFHREFSKTPEGIRLSNNTRWSPYQGNLDNNQYQDLMGCDVNNLKHCELTYGITCRFIRSMNKFDPGFFNPEEKQLLLLSAIMHDYPEGFTKKGDVNYYLKTAQDEEEELSFIEPIVTKALGQKNSEISEKVKDILQNRESKLGRFFNSVERFGYIRTGLIAWKKSKNDKQDQQISSNLVLLTKDSLTGHIPKIIEYSSQYPPINEFLLYKEKQITDAFNKIPNIVLNQYQSKDQLTKMTQFYQAQKYWQQWIQLNSRK